MAIATAAGRGLQPVLTFEAALTHNPPGLAGGRSLKRRKRRAPAAGPANLSRKAKGLTK
jgi:hypothetical protein